MMILTCSAVESSTSNGPVFAGTYVVRPSSSHWMGMTPMMQKHVRRFPVLRTRRHGRVMGTLAIHGPWFLKHSFSQVIFRQLQPVLGRWVEQGSRYRLGL